MAKKRAAKKATRKPATIATVSGEDQPAEQTTPEQPDQTANPEQPAGQEQPKREGPKRECPNCHKLWPTAKRVCDCGQILRQSKSKKQGKQGRISGKKQPAEPTTNGASLSSQLKAARQLIDSTGGIDQAIEMLLALRGFQG